MCQKISRIITSNTVPGTPYQVRVVAFTSVGMGVLGDYVVFFSEELTPTKPPDNVQANWLNSTTVKVAWTPLTLVEAQGFPQYRIVLTPFSTYDQRRQIEVNVVYTDKRSVVFPHLDNNTEYHVVVGVKTNGSSSYTDSQPIDGMKCTTAYYIMMISMLLCYCIFIIQCDSLDILQLLMIFILVVRHMYIYSCKWDHAFDY